MAIPEWLFGPAGDMRPLPSPDMDVVNTVQRFGGVHNAINGARTVDVLGHRANYEFTLSHLEPEDYFWLEALYTETIPGPFFLIDPLRKNLFSREAALARPSDASGRGIKVTYSSVGDWVRVTDGPVPWNQRALEWKSLTTNPTYGGRLEFDHNTRIPRITGTPVTVSAYVNPTETVTVRWNVLDYDTGGTQLGLEYEGPGIAIQAGVWTRISMTLPEPPAGSVESAISLGYVPDSGALTTTTVLVMNPQAEFSTEATEPASGGGGTSVVIDTMDTVSPRFPLQSITLSLLEV